MLFSEKPGLLNRGTVSRTSLSAVEASSVTEVPFVQEWKGPEVLAHHS